METKQKKRGFTAKNTWFCHDENRIINYSFILRTNYRMRRIKLISCFFILFPLLTFSQVQILGKVIDQNEKPMEFVNVFVTNPDGNDFIEGSITDNNGDFQLEVPAGTYEITASFLGYKTWSKTLNLTTTKDLGNIMLVKNATALEEVVVEVEEPLIERKIDRMIFNVDQSIASQGMDGIGVLKTTPMIRIDPNNGVSIVGKNDVSVMVNNRIVNMSGNQLLNYLRSIRSQNIEKIEVITTPPAKYDAQGNSGIINIVLKNKMPKGWSGNITSTYIRKTFNNFLNNFTINYQSKRLSSSLKLRQTNKKINSYEKTSVEGNQSVYMLDERIDRYDNIGANYSLDYEISDKSRIGFIYDLGINRMNLDVNNTSSYFSEMERDSILTTYAEHSEKTYTNTLNLYYDLQLDSLNKKLSIGANYYSNIPKYRINFNTFNQSNRDYYKTYSKISYNIYSGQLDLSLPYEFGKIETGVKFTYFNNDSDLKFYNYNNSKYVINPDGSNIFNYDEENYAGYLSVNKNFNKKWSTKIGIRYEYSNIEGYSPRDGKNIKYNYGRWFPTAYISFKPNDNNTINFNYSRRINRPFFSALNPNRWYTNPYSYSQGNSLLQPSFSNNLEFGYSFKNLIFATIYYQNIKDSYSQLVSFQDGIKSSTYANMYDQNNIGINLSYYNTFFEDWELSLNGNLTYHNNISIIPKVSGQKGINFRYNIDNTITLNKNKTFFFIANFSHILPGVYGILKTRGYSMLNLGSKFSFLDDQLQINILFQDIFKGAISKGYAIYSDYITRIENYYDFRGGRISISYSFGNKKIKGSNKKINFEEKQRAN